jgi:caffeoyl-CoA O-methyltransferase
MEDRPIADPEIEAYAAAHSTAESAEQAAVARSTREFSQAHGMMVGQLEGGLLAMLVAISGARRVLEIGTFTGYSALAMAAALPDDGHIVTCEVDARHAEQARSNFAASPYGSRIELRTGPALATIGSLDGPFDLVFIDADKPGYAGYYEAVLPLLAPGGFIVADNTLWSGRVLDPSPTDRDTLALKAFNDLVAADPRVRCVMLTVRDGVTLIRRRGG